MTTLPAGLPELFFRERFNSLSLNQLIIILNAETIRNINKTSRYFAPAF
jgi:hypothetical protein